jgi:hypothetical protein
MNSLLENIACITILSRELGKDSIYRKIKGEIIKQ